MYTLGNFIVLWIFMYLNNTDKFTLIWNIGKVAECDKGYYKSSSDNAICRPHSK